MVDCNGRITFSYGNIGITAQSAQQYRSRVFAVDRNGHIFVAATRDKSRIDVLNMSLGKSAELAVTVDGGLRRPYALFLDDSRGRLYVGDDLVIVLDHAVDNLHY